MRKIELYFYGAILCVFYACSSKDNEIIVDPTNDGEILLKVKEVTFYTVNAMNERVNNAEIEKFEYTYDGFKLKTVKYATTYGSQSNGTDYNISSYTYSGDEISQIVQIVNPKPNDKAVAIYVQKFKYEKSRLIEFVEKDSLNNIQRVKETYTLNTDGSIAVKRIFGIVDSVNNNSYYTIKFTNEGQVSEIIGDGKTQTSHKYTYDKKNNPLKNVKGLDKINFINAKSEPTRTNMFRDEAGLILWYGAFYEEKFKYNDLNFPILINVVEKSNSNTTGMRHAEIKYTY